MTPGTRRCTRPWRPRGVSRVTPGWAPPPPASITPPPGPAPPYSPGYQYTGGYRPGPAPGYPGSDVLGGLGYPGYTGQFSYEALGQHPTSIYDTSSMAKGLSNYGGIYVPSAAAASATALPSKWL